MLLTISRFFVYLAIAAPILVNRTLFFPFITGKQIFFRVCVEAALAFLLMHLFALLLDDRHRAAAWAAVKKHLTHPIIICLSIFALALVVAAITSPTPGVAFWSNYERGDGAFQVLHYVLFAILIKLLFTSEKNLRRLILTHIGVSVVVCAYAFGQIATPPGNQSFFIAAADRVSGTLGNPSYLAGYLIFTLACITYLFLKTKDALARAGLGALALIQVFLMIKAQTLGAALGVFVGLLVFAFHLWWTLPQAKLRKLAGIIGISVLGLTILFLSTKHLNFWQDVPLFNRLTNFESAYEGIQPRLWSWNSALQGVKERPLTGWGLENYGIPFDRHYNPYHYGIESFFDRTHNIFLEYLIGGGFLAFIPWLLVFVFYYRALRKREPSFWKSVAFVVPIIYLVQGIFLFDVLPIYISFLVFLIFIVNTNPPEHDRPHLLEALSDNRAFTYTSMGLVAIAIGFLMYTTAFRPLKRNMMIVDALNHGAVLTQELGKVAPENLTVTPEAALAGFQNAVAYPSPVGKGEAIEMYHKFVPEMLGIVAQIPDVDKNEVARRDVLSIVNTLNTILDENPRVVPGIKERFSNAALNIRVGLVFNLPELVVRGRTILEEELASAPNRIEMVAVLIDVARITKDEALLNRWAPVATRLRPDIFAATSTPTQ